MSDIRIEPANYGHTGFGIGLHRIRRDFSLTEDAKAYALDAPTFVPRGSTQGREQWDTLRNVPYVYISTTVGRE